MAYSRITNSITRNAVQYDALGNVVLPNGLRVLGLQTAGFVKAYADGIFYIDSSGGSGGSGGHIILNSAGTALPQQPNLKFNRLTVTNDGINSLTLVTRPADSSVGTTPPASPVVGDVWTSSETWKTYKYYDGYWIEYGTGTVTGGGGVGSGTVTFVSVVSTNGFAGTVANATTTPAISLSTTVTGILKGNGTSVSAAVAGTDYLLPNSLYTDYDSTVSGLRNSINKVFTTSFSFVSGSTKVYVNGLRYTPGASYDYQETGSNQITFTNAPDSGDLLIIEYTKS